MNWIFSGKIKYYSPTIANTDLLIVLKKLYVLDFVFFVFVNEKLKMKTHPKT